MFFISNSVLSVYDCDNNYDYKDDQEIEEQNERGVGEEKDEIGIGSAEKSFRGKQKKGRN